MSKVKKGLVEEIEAKKKEEAKKKALTAKNIREKKKREKEKLYQLIGLAFIESIKLNEKEGEYDKKIAKILDSIQDSKAKEVINLLAKYPELFKTKKPRASNIEIKMKM